MIGIEGWGTAESLFNPVLDNQSILLMGKLRCQGHAEPGLESWHQAMTREAWFLGLYPLYRGPGDRGWSWKDEGWGTRVGPGWGGQISPELCSYLVQVWR